MSLFELKNQKPMLRWKESMEEGDELFTEESILASEKVLDKYIDDLISLGKNPEKDVIMECVKKTVLELNELNEKYDYFIETMEREELWEFIDKAAKEVGLEVEGDITEEWRDW